MLRNSIKNMPSFTQVPKNAIYIAQRRAIPKKTAWKSDVISLTSLFDQRLGNDENIDSKFYLLVFLINRQKMHSLIYIPAIL